MLAPPPFQSPELVDLFTTYTASPDSIGAHLAHAAARDTERDPLLVVTGTDVALYPGAGEPPVLEAYRLGSRGFKELAGVSHLGPAVATLARLRELDPDGGWKSDAARLAEACATARAANSPELWRSRIGVRAFAGREAAIAAMVGYACQVTERFLTRALDDPEYLTMAAVRRDYIEGPAVGLPVSFSKVMIATFFLTGMDVAHRLITWLDGIDIGWERAMVILAGQVGRPTAGVTEESHSIAGVVHAVSRGRLPRERLYVAPHAPVFPPLDAMAGGTAAAAALEGTYRRLWAGLRATSDLGGEMFTGYPRFAPPATGLVPVRPGSATVHEKPAVAGPGDWLALITRLRVVMEDPRQLLSGAVTDYASGQLVAAGNDPSAVFIPGLDGEPYPHDSHLSFPSGEAPRR